MLFKSWLRKLKSLITPTTNPAVRRAPRVSLELEVLEDRTVLSTTKASPGLILSAGPSVTYGSGVPLTASAILSGGTNPTGTITFTLYGPGGAVVDTETATVNGAGTYSTPQGYLPAGVGTYQWSAFYGGDANDNPASGQFSPTATSTLTGLSDIYGMTVDASGNLYVAESGPGQVAVFAPGSTTPSKFLTGVNNPTAVAFDPSGNLLVASAFTSTLARFAPGSTTPAAYLTGTNDPQALTFNASGDLFVSNAGSNTVTEYAPGGTSPSATLTGVVQPAGLAFDSSGDLFVASGGDNTLREFAPGSLTPTATQTGLSGPGAVAVDAAGNVFVANNNGTVSEFAAGSLRQTATLTGLTGISSMAFDKEGNLFVVNHTADTVSEFAPGNQTATATLTGLSLPLGMTFDAQGDLYVGDWGNGTVSVFSRSADLETVTPASTTVAVSDAGGTYNGAPFPASVLVNGASTLEGLSPTLTYYQGSYTLSNLPSSGGSSMAPTQPGSYTVLASFAGSTDYAAASTVADFTISQATTAVSVTDNGGSYNGTASAASGSVTDASNNVSLGDLPAAAFTYYAGTYSTLTDLDNALADGLQPLSAAPVHVGDYTVLASYAGDTDHQASAAAGTFSITPYALSYQIGSDSQTYGSPADLTKDLPGTLRTGVNNETLTITYASTGDTATAHVGQYAITGTLSDGTGKAANYSVTLTPGTLTVNPRPITYSIGSLAQIYGQPANLGLLPSTFRTGVNGETLGIGYYSSGDTVLAPVGNYAITGILGNGTGRLSDYSVALAPGTLEVLPAGQPAVAAFVAPGTITAQSAGINLFFFDPNQPVEPHFALVYWGDSIQVVFLGIGQGGVMQLHHHYKHKDKHPRQVLVRVVDARGNMITDPSGAPVGMALVTVKTGH